MKEKVVFLFGAGAVLSWGGPSTSELTELVRQTGFYIIDNKTRITEFIYQKLMANGYTDGDVNFETIINVIEELIVFYSKFNKDKDYPSLLKCFLSNRFENEIFNFSVKGGNAKHGYKLQIPKNVDYFYANRALHDETPKQFFLLELLNVILSAIIGRISNYAWHTEGHTKIDLDSPVSKSLVKWIKSFASRHVLRLYTLNYDRIFKVLLEKSDIHLFEGFVCGECPPLGLCIRADIPMIVNDDKLNTFYNLHGSANWEVKALDYKLLPNPEIVLVSGVSLPINSKPASFQIEKGKTLLVTNIITGFQKAQKTLLPPFRQMHSSFDKDCINANEIFIIGYSFGDEHINQSLKMAIRHNSNLKVKIIDPCFISNNKDQLLALEFFPNKNASLLQATEIGENIYSYFNGDFIVYTLSFEDYLNKEIVLPWESLCRT